MSKQKQDDPIYELCVAISAEFHGNRRRYTKFYNKHAPQVSGFPGLWMYCVDAAKAFNKVEDKYDDDSYDFLTAVEYMANAMFEDVLDAKQLESAADRAILMARFEDPDAELPSGKKPPFAVDSLDELKTLAALPGGADCFIRLNGGAQSSKTIRYYEGQRKPWEVYHSISDAWEKFYEKAFKDDMIVGAIDKKALIYRGKG